MFRVGREIWFGWFLIFPPKTKSWEFNAIILQGASSTKYWMDYTNLACDLGIKKKISFSEKGC